MKQGSFHILFIEPLHQQKGRVALIVLALIFLGLSQSGLLLFLGPFLKALFGLGEMGLQVPVEQLLPAGVLKVLPWLQGRTFARGDLVVMVPLGMLAAAFLRNISLYIYQLQSAALSLFVAKVYRTRLFAQILAAPYTEISQKTPAEWMSHLMNDVLFLQTRFSDILNSFVRDTVVMVAAIVTLFFIHWQTALVLVCLGPFVAWGMGKAGKKIAFYAGAFQSELALIADFILELRKRFFFVRGQKGEMRELNRFARVNEAYYRLIRKSLWVRSSFAPVMEFLGFGVFALILLLVAYGWMGNDFQSVNLLVFFGALGMLLRPLRNIGEQITKFQETQGALGERASVIARSASDEAIQLLGTDDELDCFVGNTIRTLIAGYGKSPAVVAENLVLTPGKTVAIIGPSGAGKSTLVKALAGLLPPQRWDADLAWEDFQKRVSMVSQTPFLFEESLRANLQYGAEAPFSDAILCEGLQKVNVEKEVLDLAGGLDYAIRALGRNLSGGQVQRLVIARALLREKGILLLDEATSAVDEGTEKDITWRLIESCRKGGQSLLAVTHRLKWLNHFDEVWFIEEGRLTMQGRHSDLMQVKRYSDFYRVAF